MLTLISLSAAGIAGLVGYVALNGDFLCSVSKRLSGLDAQHAVDLVVPVAFVGFVVAAFGRRAPRLLLVDLLMTTG